MLFIKPVKVEFSLSLGRNALSEMMIVHIFRFHNGINVFMKSNFSLIILKLSDIHTLDSLITDQCQPHEKFWTARQSSQVVNWVKTMPGLAGNQIPFGGTRFGFTNVGVYNTSIRIRIRILVKIPS